MVQVDISTMPAGIHEVVLYPHPDDLDLNEEQFCDIEARVRLDVGDQQILAVLDVSANSRLVCDRTLVPFVMRVNGSFTIVFTKKGIDSNETDESVKYLDSATRELDVTEEMRDTILLAVPLRKIAPEATEIELVLTYADNVAEKIDPRWEALNKLKSEDVGG